MTADAACHDGVALVQQAQFAAVLVHHVANIVLLIIVEVDTEVLAGAQQIQNFFQIFTLPVFLKDGIDFLGVQVTGVLGVNAVDPPAVVIARKVVILLPLLGGIQLHCAGLEVVTDLHGRQAFIAQGNKQTFFHDCFSLSFIIISCDNIFCQLILNQEKWNCQYRISIIK